MRMATVRDVPPESGETAAMSVRLAALASGSELLHTVRAAVGATAVANVQTFDRRAELRWRIVVSLDASDGFAVAVRLNTESYDRPRCVSPTVDQPPYGIFLPNSFHSCWFAYTCDLVADLDRLRCERAAAWRDAPTQWRHPAFVRTGRRVRCRDTARAATVAVVASEEFPVALRWHDTGELAYVPAGQLVADSDGVERGTR